MKIGFLFYFQKIGLLYFHIVRVLKKISVIDGTAYVYMATFTCYPGLKTFKNLYALPQRTITSLNFNFIPGKQIKSFNIDLSSSRYILVLCTIEIYNEACYITRG